MLFAVSIVLCHSMLLPQNYGGIHLHITSLGVEYFFILSGFLMAKSAKRRESSFEVGKDTVKFIFKKMTPVIKVYLIAIIFELVSRVLFRPHELNNLSLNIWDLLFARIFGLGGSQGLLVGATWYLFALFPAMFLLYPLLIKYRDAFLYVIAPLVSLFVFGWFSHVYGHINLANQFDGYIVSLGLLRAISEICIGCVSYLVCEKIREYFTSKPSLLFTLFEIVPLCSIFYFATKESRSQRDFLCILLICIGIIAAFSGKSYTNIVLIRVNNKFISFLSKCSLCLYLNHYVWLRNLQALRLNISFEAELAVYISLSLCTAFICFLLLKYVDRLFSYIGLRLAKL